MTTKKKSKYPPRWYEKNGTIFYVPPAHARDQWDGKSWFALGKTFSEALRTWNERTQSIDGGPGRDTPIGEMSVDKLLVRYLTEVTPLKAPITLKFDTNSTQRLRSVFGDMTIGDLEPHHIYTYVHKASEEHGLATARQDVAVIRHALTKAVEWGVLRQNQLVGQLRIPMPNPRDRYVEDWEIAQALSIPIPKHRRSARGLLLIQTYIQFKLMTGLRRMDILNMTVSAIQDDGIHVMMSKTKKRTGRRHIYVWDTEGEFRRVVDQILAIPPKRVGNGYLFCTENGDGYCNQETGRCDSFDSIWHRFMKRLLDRQLILERFQERDLRAKTASDSETLEDASNRLGHADTAITQRVYRRKARRIEPLLRSPAAVEVEGKKTGV